MIKQNQITASEHPYGISRVGQKIITKLPPLVALEAEFYLKNNQPVNTLGHYCLRCLKAHLKKKMRKQNLPKFYEQELDKIIQEEEGHNGYYMDGEELLKV